MAVICLHVCLFFCFFLFFLFVFCLFFVSLEQIKTRSGLKDQFRSGLKDQFRSTLAGFGKSLRFGWCKGVWGHSGPTCFVADCFGLYAASLQRKFMLQTAHACSWRWSHLVHRPLLVFLVRNLSEELVTHYRIVCDHSLGSSHQIMSWFY